MLRMVAESLAGDFNQPDDDFFPQIIILPGDGTSFEVMPIDLRFFENNEAKEYLTEVRLPPILDAFGAKLVGWLVSAWQVEFNAPDEATARRMAAGALDQHPDRREIVSLTGIDALSVATTQAEILRYGHAPTLGTWEGVNTHKNTSALDGRLVDPIQAALRDSSGKRDNQKIARLFAR